MLCMLALILILPGCQKEEPETNIEEQVKNDANTKEDVVSKINDVFPGKKISSYLGYTFSYNDDGTLAGAIKAENDKYSFEYEGETVVMKATRPRYVSTYTFHMGENGFATTCSDVCETNPDWSSTVKFTYDSNGHLIKYQEPENSDYIMDLYVQEDNVVKVESNHWTGKSDVALVYGHDSSHGFMAFNVFFDLDSFDMNFAYFAGLLGVSSKTLPISAVASWSDEEIVYSWGFDNAGYPKSLSTSDLYGSDPIEITWK